MTSALWQISRSACRFSILNRFSSALDSSPATHARNRPSVKGDRLPPEAYAPGSVSLLQKPLSLGFWGSYTKPPKQNPTQSPWSSLHVLLVRAGRTCTFPTSISILNPPGRHLIHGHTCLQTCSMLSTQGDGWTSWKEVPCEGQRPNQTRTSPERAQSSHAPGGSSGYLKLKEHKSRCLGCHWWPAMTP